MEDTCMSINFEQVRQQLGTFPVIQQLLNFSEKTPTFTVGYYLKSLTDSQLEEWLEFVEVLSATRENTEFSTDIENLHTAMFMAICILGTAEGLTIEELERDIGSNVEFLINLITITGLERKGLVTAFFENMTFEVTEEDLPIVRRKD